MNAPPRFLIAMQHHFSRLTGGAELQAWMLATELARRGWDVHYASETPDTTETRVLDGVTLHPLPVRDSYWHVNREPVIELLKYLRPQVTYTRMFSPYLGYLAEGASAETFFVWSTASRFDGRPWPALAVGRRGVSMRDYLRRLPVYLHWNAIARKGRKRADLILAQQSEQQHDLARLGLQAEILRNSYPPVPETEVQSHDGQPVIIWADSIKPLKRPEAFLELAHRCRDLPAIFQMLGNIYEKELYQRPIDDAVRTLPNFRYAGFIPLNRIDEYFHAAHVHVKTSLPIEGFPNTFVQAWLHGVPVASYEVELEGRLTRGELGRCARTMDELEAAVRELVTHPELRREIGARARAFAVREFDLQANVDRLESLLAARGVRLPQRP
jgi:glycosyltransferase involved in cell wall biosynthesis